jgi:hypothetical protein
MLAATPEIASYSFATAVILGDASRVRREIGRRPALAMSRKTENDHHRGGGAPSLPGASPAHGHCAPSAGLGGNPGAPGQA